MDSDSILEGLREAVRNYDKDRARRFAEKAVEKGIDPVEALEDGLAKVRAANFSRAHLIHFLV